MRAAIVAVALLALTQPTLLVARSGADEPPLIVPAEAGIEARHPSEMIVLAAHLFKNPDRKADALFWYYAGQLRFRAHLQCNPPEPGGEGALAGALFETVGQEINLYAGDDVDRWIATIDKVLAWDAATPERFEEDMGERCEAAWEKQRAGLTRLRGMILAQRSEIEKAPVRKR